MNISNQKKGIAPVVAVVITLIIVAAIGGFFIVSKDDTTKGVTPTPKPTLKPVSTPTPSPSPTQTASTPTPAPSLKTFEITAKQWEFIPSTITVKEGDRVKLNIKSIDVEHGFNIPEYNINRNLPPNQIVTIEFVADKKGTFNFFCSVPCGSGHKGMAGNLVVG